VVNEVEVYREQAAEVCNESGIDVETNARSPFPPGYGFGVSAAALMAHAIVAYAFTGKPVLKALQLAHALEVKHKTGLGDVMAEYIGGVALRLKPGAPGIGVAYRIIPRERVDLVVARLREAEPTSSMLSRMGPEDLELGKKLLRKVIESEDLRDFFECSRAFTRRLFDYSRVEGVLSGLQGVIEYYLKKSALVAWVERDHLVDVLNNLEKKGFRASYATISNVGVILVHTA